MLKEIHMKYLCVNFCRRTCQSLGRHCPRLLRLDLESCNAITDTSLIAIGSVVMHLFIMKCIYGIFRKKKHFYGYAFMFAGFASWYQCRWHHRSWATSNPVSCWRPLAGLPSWYLLRPLSLAILPWVGATSTGDGFGDQACSECSHTGLSPLKTMAVNLSWPSSWH